MGVAANYPGSIPAAIAPGAGKANTLYAREAGRGARRQTVLEFKDFKIAGVDSSGSLFTKQVYTFPQGRILFEGASALLDLFYDALGVDVDAAGDFALGSTVGVLSGGLTTTEGTYIQTTETLAAASHALVAIGSQAISSGIGAPQLLDGVSSAKAVWFNHIVDDADSDVAGTPTNVVINGEIVLNWTFVGTK